MQKFYYELRVTPHNHYPLYLDLISELTQEALEELDGIIICRSESSLENIKAGIEQFSTQLSIALKSNIECDIEYNKKENKDWISKYKNSITPVEAGKFYIHPSWDKSKEDKINIIINPALAFGSGHHETTSSCLELISRYTSQDNTLLDVGCGSGILGIAAAKLGACVDICDTDSISIENSIENFNLNTTSINKSWVGSALLVDTKYDIVVANIVADVLVMISSDLKKSLKDNGILILSGILSKYKDKVLNKFKQYEIKEIIHKGDWITIALIKGTK